MKVEQIATLINGVSSEVLGKSDITAENLSKVVDMGKEIFDSDKVDNYVKSLVNHIGKVIFVNRPYSGSVPSILMDSWEYGSVLEKITAEIPEAEENDSWALKDGTEYKQDIFKSPKVSAKFFNSKNTFEIPISFTERQVKESFSSVEELNAFISMIYGAIDKSMTIKIDSLVMRTINNMIAQTLHHDFADVSDVDYSKKTSNRAVNLLKLYNDKYGTALTADKCLYDANFIRFASFVMGTYKDRLSKISTLFNVGGKERFTTNDMMHIVLLADFKNAAAAFLESNTFHNELVALPDAETVPYWQGSGEDYSFNKVSDIHVNISTSDSTTAEIIASGIIGVMFDRDSMGVWNTDRRVTTNYNAKAEFYNNWFKFDASYFNDLNENFIVFFVA